MIMKSVKADPNVKKSGKIIDCLDFIFLLFGLFSTFISFNVKAPFTNSGVFMMYLSDLGFVLLGILFLIRIFVLQEKPQVKKIEIISIATVFIFFAYCAFVTLARNLMGQRDIKSLLIPRVIFSSVWILLYMVFYKPKFKLIRNSLGVFTIFLSLVSIVLSFIHSEISYDIMQSHIVRTHNLLFILPLNAFFYYKDKRDKINKPLFTGICLYTNLFTSIFTVMASGSRLDFLLISLNVLAMLILICIYNWKELFLYITICATSIVGVYIGSHFDNTVKYGVVRSPIYSIINKYQEPEIDEDQDKEDNDTLRLSEEAISSKSDSNSARKQAWTQAAKDILKNPIFGSGFKQYEVTYQKVNHRNFYMPPHNFVLEYTLAYGLIGLVLFFLILATPLFPYLKLRNLGNKKNIATYILLILSAMNIVAVGLFQTIFLNPAILVILFFEVGAYRTNILIDEYIIE